MKQKKKVMPKTKTTKSSKIKKALSKRIIIGIIILFVTLFIIVIFTNQPPNLTGNAQSMPSVIVPTFGSIDDCHANGTCPTNAPTSIEPASNNATTIEPASNNSTNDVSPTVQAPCVSTQNSTVNAMDTTAEANGNKGFIQLILQFLQELLQLIEQLLGGTTTPTPVVTEPTQAVQPTTTAQPTTQAAQPTTTTTSPTSAPCPPTSTPQPTTPTTVPTTSTTAPTVTIASCTTPVFSSSDATGTFDNGGFDVYNNAWNSTHGPQTIYACAYNNWYVVSTQTGTAVETYPSVQMNYNNETISSYKTLASSFAETAPTNSGYIWEAAYDIWTNGLATANSNEIMIWTDNHGQTPAGDKKATVTIDGQSYDLWESSDAKYIAFVANTNEATGSIDIQDFFNYLITNGILSSTTSLNQINFGWEICSTNNTAATFTMNGFSLINN
jgi:hypothetical protein